MSKRKLTEKQKAFAREAHLAMEDFKQRAWDVCQRVGIYCVGCDYRNGSAVGYVKADYMYDAEKAVRKKVPNAKVEVMHPKNYPHMYTTYRKEKRAGTVLKQNLKKFPAGWDRTPAHKAFTRAIIALTKSRPRHNRGARLIRK